MGGGCLAGEPIMPVSRLNGELTLSICRCRPAMCARQTSFVDCGNGRMCLTLPLPAAEGEVRRLRIHRHLWRLPRLSYVDHGDWLDEDQWCSTPRKAAKKSKSPLTTPEETAVAWDEASGTSAELVPRIPPRDGQKGVERHARENGIALITIELMEELRKKRFGNDAPVFNLT